MRSDKVAGVSILVKPGESTGQLCKSLMAKGKNGFLRLKVLHFRLLYLQPEGRYVNGPCWGWVESFRTEAAILWTLLRYSDCREAVEPWWCSQPSPPLYTDVCGPSQLLCCTTQWCSWSGGSQLGICKCYKGCKVSRSGKQCFQNRSFLCCWFFIILLFLQSLFFCSFPRAAAELWGWNRSFGSPLLPGWGLAAQRWRVCVGETGVWVCISSAKLSAFGLLALKEAHLRTNFSLRQSGDPPRLKSEMEMSHRILEHVLTAYISNSRGKQKKMSGTYPSHLASNDVGVFSLLIKAGCWWKCSQQSEQC